VSQDLGVKVVRLERRVVHVHLGAPEEEEAVVVDEVGSAIEPEEDGDVDLFVVVDELGCTVSVRRMERGPCGGLTSLG
jgi:hypothetical protein